MANTNIKLFDENKSNMMSDADYGANSQRANGVQTGVASSQLQNKFQYQMSLMAYAVAQLMIANGYDAMDSAAVSTFVGNFSDSVVQKVKDKASASEAAAGTNDLKWISAKQLVDVATSIAKEAAKGMVKYNTPQTLTDAQKQQARDNINAPAPYEAGDNIAITGSVIATKVFPCNPNLLDNWYFGNPVNQRGQTSYSQIGYTFDRWMIEGHAFYVDKSENYGGSLHLVMGSEPQTFMQNIETMPQQQMTASILLGGASVGGKLLVQSWPGAVDTRMVPIQSEMTTMTFTPTQSGSYRIAVFNEGNSPDIFVRAFKLELGHQQTLAHQENGVWVLNEIPNKADQLAICSNYDPTTGEFKNTTFAPAYTYGTADMTAGVSALENGKLYFVYQ